MSIKSKFIRKIINCIQVLKCSKINILISHDKGEIENHLYLSKCLIAFFKTMGCDVKNGKTRTWAVQHFNCLPQEFNALFVRGLYICLKQDCLHMLEPIYNLQKMLLGGLVGSLSVFLLVLQV